MVTVINTMEVRDFNEWKQHFEAGAENRTRAGVNVKNVYTDTANQQKITVVSEVQDTETAKAFLGAMRPIFEKMVVSEPHIMILDSIV
jgi:hypothetical protein